jgi:hypothetical protein
MSRRLAVHRVAVAGLAAAVAASTACGGDGGGGGDAGTGPDADPVEVTPTPPRAPLVPEALPEGFVVEGVTTGGTAPDEPGSRSLLIGDPDREPGPDAGPAIVVGESSGSASIAGPASADGEPVSDLGIADSFDPYVADDGPWTWVVFDDAPGCIEDCLDYVAGRGVSDEDLIAVARGTDYGDAGPVVDPGAIPDGMAPLVTAEPSDGMRTTRGAGVSLRSADGGWMEIQQVEAPAELAALWGFWVDDAGGTTIRGGPGWAGRAGLTYEGGDEVRVWVEDGTVVAVLGWGVDGDIVDEVVDGLRAGTPDDLVALGGEVVAREPTPGDVMCGSTVLSGPVGDDRWVVGFDTGGGSGADSLEVCTGLVTPAGPTGGSSAGGTLPPVGSLSAETLQVSGGPVGGTFVHGVAPPGTATVELVTPDGAAHPLQLSEDGPRDQGERWYATFEPALVGGSNVVARGAGGGELARAPVGG